MFGRPIIACLTRLVRHYFQTIKVVHVFSSQFLGGSEPSYAPASPKETVCSVIAFRLECLYR